MGAWLSSLCRGDDALKDPLVEGNNSEDSDVIITVAGAPAIPEPSILSTDESEILKAQITSANSERQELQKQLEQIEAKNRSLLENVEELTTEKTEFEQILSEKVALQKKLLVIETNEARLLTQVQILETEKLTFSENVAELNRKQAELQQKLEQETAAKTQTVSELSSLVQLKALQEQQLSQASVQLGLVNAAKEELQSQLQASEACNLKLSTSSAELSTKQAPLQQELKQETETRMVAEEEGFSSLSTTSKTLKQQLAEVNAEKEQLQKQLQEKGAENLRLSADIAELNREKAELQAQLRQKDEKNASELSTLQQKLTAAQNTLKDLAADKKTLENGSPVKNYYKLKEAYQRQTEKLKHPLAVKLFGPPS